jgi:hypothetical protein
VRDRACTAIGEAAAANKLSEVPRVDAPSSSGSGDDDFTCTVHIPVASKQRQSAICASLGAPAMRVRSLNTHLERHQVAHRVTSCEVDRKFDDGENRRGDGRSVVSTSAEQAASAFEQADDWLRDLDDSAESEAQEASQSGSWDLSAAPSSERLVSMSALIGAWPKYQDGSLESAPVSNAGPCLGALPRPMLAQIGHRTELAQDGNTHGIRRQDHDPSPAGHWSDFNIYLVADQAIQKQLEDLQAQGVIQHLVLLPGGLHVGFAIVTSIWETFSDDLNLRGVLETILNVKSERSEHIGQRGQGHFEFSCEVDHICGVGILSLRVQKFLDEHQPQWTAADSQKPSVEWCKTQARAYLQSLRDREWGADDRREWLELEYAWRVSVLRLFCVARRNGCVKGLMACLHEFGPMLFSSTTHPYKQDEILSILIGKEMLDDRRYDTYLRHCIALRLSGSANGLDDLLRPHDHAPDGRVLGDELIEILNFLLKRHGLTSLASLRRFMAILNLPWQQMWQRMRCDVDCTEDDAHDHTHHGTSRPYASPVAPEQAVEDLSRAAAGEHKARHLQFNDKPNYVGSVLCIWRQYRKLVAMDAPVPDESPALYPSCVHGAFALMREMRMRQVMRKTPIAHTTKERGGQATAQDVTQVMQMKTQLDAAQFLKCKSHGCRRHDCGDPEHRQMRRAPRQPQASAAVAATADTQDKAEERKRRTDQRHLLTALLQAGCVSELAAAPGTAFKMPSAQQLASALDKRGISRNNTKNADLKIKHKMIDVWLDALRSASWQPRGSETAVGPVVAAFVVINSDRALLAHCCRLPAACCCDLRVTGAGAARVARCLRTAADCQRLAAANCIWLELEHCASCWQMPPSWSDLPL